MKYFKHILFLLLWSIVNGQWSMVNAQELEARVTINHTQIETTRTEVFDALQGSASYCQLLLVMCGNNILLLPFLAKPKKEGE